MNISRTEATYHSLRKLKLDPYRRKKMGTLNILKFGGTSLKDEPGREAAAQRIAERVKEDATVIVVVSAIGRRGDPYATDSLLTFAQSSGGRLNRRDQDLLLSCGETISAIIVSQLLKAKGIAARPLTGSQAGIITDDNFTNARIIRVDTSSLRRVIENSSVPVVAGFQGVSETGEITTLGRGASDTTACALGAAMSADLIEIYTDVPGVMTADPTIVKAAQLIERADYREILALAHKGAKVIHPEALAIAATHNIPLHVRNSQRREAGTEIKFIDSARPVTGIASHPEITHFRITNDLNGTQSPDFRFFHRLADINISVNFINLQPVKTTFVVQSDLSDPVEEALSSLGLEYDTSDEFAKISVIGTGMTGRPGMMSRIILTLSEQGIKIFEATDSTTSISCLILREDEARALRALHKAFRLDKPLDQQ